MDMSNRWWLDQTLYTVVFFKHTEAFRVTSLRLPHKSSKLFMSSFRTNEHLFEMVAVETDVVNDLDTLVIEFLDPDLLDVG